ncbi:class I SAM-dependent methyltransferase [Agrococcus sp. Marseille-Q4369]|uniref:class I SAM-dependent methyltransferase n=1 Tax=Agrococcus sp. Marseille-Q4369 TaxID=2810513 RepID=UPI001B8AD587|nr:class I SAM-dependent methyltransferase [Agrococcus sp. Marseille-Q4369]QUW18261.1 class I SAM-dependent methyltransferase [Agrococcus sp. Marseille-Q4369]
MSTIAAAVTTSASEIKAKHAAMWALGDYPAVAHEVIPATGPRLVEAVDIQAGERVLDIAAGDGNASVPAAERGASVVASDLTPELLEAGRARSADSGLDITWQAADAEALPFRTHEFDVAISCVGIMFAPFHEAAARELVRVVRPGGRIGLLAWTPEGFIGEMFTIMKPFAPAPPPGAQPAVLWGSEAHVRELLGARVELTFRKELLDVRRFGSGADFRDFFKRTYGPTIVTYRGIADQPERVAELDRELEALGERYRDGDLVQLEYLLTTGTVR